MVVDILYVLADKDSRKSERELKLSLRSLEKNCKDLGKVYIATDIYPDWLDNYVAIPCVDYNYNNPELNLMEKLAMAVDSSISNEFLLMNDDFFMMKPFTASEYPYYYMWKARLIENPSRWQQVFNDTIDYLERKGVKEVLDYCVHCPVLVNKNTIQNYWDLFKSVNDKYCGYSSRMIIGNLTESDNKKKVKDCKLWHGEPLRESETGCISTDDKAYDVLDKIESIFNEKSKFEK